MSDSWPTCRERDGIPVYRSSRRPCGGHRTVTEPATRGKRPLLDESLSLIALDLILDPVLVWEIEEGPEFRCVAVNRAALEVSGFDGGQLVGKRLEDIKSLDEAAISRRQFEAAMEGTRSSVERTFDFPKGTVSLTVTATAVRNDEGRCTHIFTVSPDPTSERQAEIARQGQLEADEARRQAEQVLSRRDVDHRPGREDVARQPCHVRHARSKQR